MGERLHLNRDVADIERRLGCMALYGTIAEADYTTARVRVRSGPILSNWLPFLTSRAEGDVTWHPPEIGEQVLVLCPGGELNQGCVLGALYRAAAPAPADRVEVSTTVWKDGAFERYDRDGHHYRLEVPAGGSITLAIGDSELVMTADNVTVRATRIDLNP